MTSVIIVDSYHHSNTLKIANAFARVLNCSVISPEQAEAEDLTQYDLIGFGSGIDSGRHYKPLLDLADGMPEVLAKPVFIFSTSAIQGYTKVEKDHALLREKLQSKGYAIAGEFSCKGYNTNSFLKFMGGMNKGKPDENDFRNAEEFATALLSSRPVPMILFNNIETDRMILKNIATEDRGFIFSLFSDEVVNRYLFDAEPVSDIQEADEIIAFYLEPEPRFQHRWILVRKSDGSKMGTCGFHCWNQQDSKVEAGYDLKEEYWGKGYMQEAMNEIISFARNQMHIKEISACIYIDNQRSTHLVEKLGFVLSGSMYQTFKEKDYLHNIYSLYGTEMR